MAHRARANALAVSLQDAQRPACCPRCLRTFAEILGKDAAALDDVRINCHGFWNACMTVISTPRTSDDLAFLEPHFQSMERQCANRTHTSKSSLGWSTTQTRMFFDAAYECIYIGLTFGPKAIVLRTKPNQGFNSSKRSHWPVTIDQMFPGSEAGSIATHVFWCTQIFSPYPLHVLNQLVIVARPIVFPVILREPLHAQLVWALVQYLHPYGSTPVKDWIWSGGRAPCTAPEDWQSIPWLALQPRYAPVWAATFLHYLQRGPDAHYDDIRRFLAGYERVLWPAVKNGYAVLATWPYADDHVVLRVTTLAVWTFTIHEVLDLPPSELSDDIKRAAHPVSDDYEAENEISIAIPIHIHLKRCANRRACFGPGCGITMQRNDGKPFQVCSRCKIVRYCSKECQKRDWTDDRQFPHKRACAAISRLLAQPGIRLDCDPIDFQRAFYQPHVLVDDQDMLVLTMTALEGSQPELKSAMLRMLVPNMDGSGTVDWTAVRAARFTPDMAESMEEWLAEQRRMRRAAEREAQAVPGDAVYFANGWEWNYFGS
ncbi:hypothetical protein EXIGLDRAFT_762683 [Exidia glandulosa HHB12029]|uniref:MYND-type domain-containing protein n=1 Tax=Exidia glandulosa HHB12029 TaxID=1314781 RepID=A0A165MK22_EXIGL|nr:hypothetical protein EXIGLDRAFT_762683 [Exidia glandulosa HHB12029]